MTETTIKKVEGMTILCLESPHLRVEIAPELGGRVVSLVEKSTQHEFLWRNSNLKLEAQSSGAEYDPNFFGGIDELLPNDLTETIDGLEYPDHGELWTFALNWREEGAALILEGTLPISGLKYRRTVELSKTSPTIHLHYRIENLTDEVRHFLWKLHAAIAIEPGDVIDCPAAWGRVVDLDYSQYHTVEPFEWPSIEGQAANVLPPFNGGIDFFYLFGLREGRMAWRRPEAGLKFEYRFDPNVFPCTWLFASYGGFMDHYTAILEPCTTMPISVPEAMKKGHCSRLEPGCALETTVTIFAGHDA